MRSGPNLITVNQALHGYLHGHRLLASSKTLGAASARELLLLADLAGPQLESFDGYIAAYSLPSDDVFVLSKTWYAAEFSRPGCVWTHTLFVAEADLKNIRDLRELDVLFRRPSGEDTAMYTEPLTIEVLSDLMYPLKQHYSKELCGGVLRDLFDGSSGSYFPPTVRTSSRTFSLQYGQFSGQHYK